MDAMSPYMQFSYLHTPISIKLKKDKLTEEGGTEKCSTLSSDENQIKILNLSVVAMKPATHVMSLWLGMMVACNAFSEK